MPEYFDFAATTPVDHRVSDLVLHFMRDEFGNSGSRTHSYGVRAKKAVSNARLQIAKPIKAEPDEIIFTSGATESNNIAILGLQDHLKKNGRTHVITMATEHKAVLEPIQLLAQSGFKVSILKPLPTGEIDLQKLHEEINSHTGLISIMHVNNETGVIHPISKVAKEIENSDIFFHVDAAQSFGKFNEDLSNDRIDLISLSGHKIYAPKGIGALVAKKRQYIKPPLKPLFFGGGQEQGLRPGTLPVPLIVGLGLASELAEVEWEKREQKAKQQFSMFLEKMSDLSPKLNSGDAPTSPYIKSISLPGIDAEAAMVLLKDLVSVSNGSACTSSNYSSSHVLKEMGLKQEEIDSTIRVSFSHIEPNFDWSLVYEKLKALC